MFLCDHSACALFVKHILASYSWADPESFVRGGPNLIFFFIYFLVDAGIEDQNITIDGSAKRHLNGVRWWAEDGPTLMLAW